MTFKIAKSLFLMLVVSIPLVRPFNIRLAGLTVPAADFIFVLCFVLWIAALIRREADVKFDKFYIFLCVYALALLISTVFSEQPIRSAVKLAGEYYLFFLAVLTFNLARDRSFGKPIAFAWLIGTGLTIIASAVGYVLFYAGYKTQASNYFLSHFGSLPAGNYPRIHALFLNANMMCNYLNVSLMIALATERSGWIKRLPCKILQIGIWLAALFTFSPGIGGMVLSVSVWYWAVFRDKIFVSRAILSAGVLAAFIFLAAALISPDTSNTDQQITLQDSGITAEVSVRVLVWQSAFRSFLAYPLTGKGTGLDAAEVHYSTLSGDNQVLLDAHNVWLSVAAQAGLPGLIAFGILIFSILQKCRFALKSAVRENYMLITLSCAFLGAFLYQGIAGSFEDARHIWILFGLIAAAGQNILNPYAEDITRRNDT